MTNTSKEAVERLLADLRAPIRVQEREMPNHVLRRANLSRLDAAKAIAALLAEREALTAEVARLTLESTNLRQMERNVQTVREHEHKRAESALAEAARLTAALEALSTLIHTADTANYAAHAARREGGV